MKVLVNGHLSIEFLQSAALNTARQVYRTLFPNSPTKFHSKEDVPVKLAEEELSCTSEQLRSAMWDIVGDGLNGQFHLALATKGDGIKAEAVDKALKLASLVTKDVANLESEVILDIRRTEIEGHEGMEILYLGEAEAEVHDPAEDRHGKVNGAEYKFKAYRLLNVPVVSKIAVSNGLPYLEITTRAIHRGAKPSSELNALRQILSDQLDIPFPPLGGIGEGIKALWDDVITARKFQVEEADGTRAAVSTAPGASNLSSQVVESELLQWEFQHGSLIFQEDGLRVPFTVDVGRAVFSFNAGTSREDAIVVIHRIIGAA